MTTLEQGGHSHRNARPSTDSRWQRYRALTPLTRPAGPAPMTVSARLLAGGYAALTVLLAVVPRWIGLDGLGAVGSVLFLLTGVGVALVLLGGPIALSAFLALSVGVSLALTITVGFVMAQFSFWHPTLLFVMALVGTAAALGWVLPTEFRQWRAQGAPRPKLGPAGGRVTALTAGGVLLCVLGAWLGRGDPTEGGLLSVVGQWWFAGVALLLVALVLAWGRGPVVALPLVALSSVTVMSQIVAYDAPTVMTAARHVGVVDFIRVNGFLDAGSDIYQAWPGLFAAGAWIGDAAGIADAMELATWFPLLITVATTIAVRVLAGRFTDSGVRAWSAAALFTLANTLNIAYFAPQSAGLLLALLVLGLVVAPPADESASARRLRVALIAVLTCVLTVTHQISPFLLVAALVALVLCRLVRPWWIPLAVAVPPLVWAAANFSVLDRFLSWEAFGRVLSNASPPAHASTTLPMSLATRLVFLAPAVVLVLVGLLALVGAVRLRNRVALGLLAAAASPISLLAASNYGQEAIFRVALFALPWLAILAVLGLPRAFGSRSPAVLTAVALTATMLFAVNAYGQTGLDWARVVRNDAADATRMFETIAQPGGALVVVGTANASPGKITARYGDVLYLNRDALGVEVPAHGDSYDATADAQEITTRLIGWTPDRQRFALVSDSVGAWGDRYGLQSYADYGRLRAAFDRSAVWVPVFIGPTTTLYEYNPGSAGAG